MRIHCFQHVYFENPGTILEWAVLNHHSISFTYFFEKNYSLPALSDVDLLLIMGGPMNVDEEEKFPWLLEEKQFIAGTIGAGKKILGICLGAQLIAAAMGRKVYPCEEKEIGFFPVQFTGAALQDPLFDHFKNPYTFFHWHGDTFDLPEHAELIASTPACKNQAYRAGENVLGLQFHPEINPELLEAMLHHEGHELAEKGNYIQSAPGMKKHVDEMEQYKKDLFLLLDKFTDAGS